MNSWKLRFLGLLAAAPLALLGCGGTGTETVPETPKASTTTPPTPPVSEEAKSSSLAPATGSEALAKVEPQPSPEPIAEAKTEPAPPSAPAPAPAPRPSVILASMLNVGNMLTVANTLPPKQDASKPADYMWQAPRQAPVDEPLTVEVPKGLPPLTPNSVVPAANPITKGKYELGRQLYFDPRLSKDGTVSCATCHNPAKGWTDQAPVSTGIKGQKGGRSAPTVLNTVYGKTMFWDGRAPSLEGQSQGPPLNPIEMGHDSYESLVAELRKIPGYQEQFLKVFGTDVTVDGMAKAIATFERVAALTGNSPYDKYQEGDLTALNDSQKRGMYLFGLRLHPDDEFDTSALTLKKANCTSCHIGFNFTDELFHNLGVGWDAEKKEFKDLGRWAISPIGAKLDSELGAFKTPTLRNLGQTAPYMHDGSEPDLKAVVEFYDKGGNPNPALDKDMKPLNLTDQEIADIVAFMEALNGEVKPVELPALPPGPDGTAPDPAKALVPPSADTSAQLQRTMHQLVLGAR